MDTILQMMMGTGLAASAGLRAGAPLLIVGLLAHCGLIHLNPSYAFLEKDQSLIVFGVITILEFFGDKVIAIDHLLDTVGTVARPIAGTLLASSALTHQDPSTTALLGVLLGGGTAFTIHAGKAVVRAKSTALSPLHLGTGNAMLSTIEDVVSIGGVGLALLSPPVAFVLALVGIVVSLLLVVAFLKTGRKLLSLLQGRRTPAVAETGHLQ